MFCGIEENDFDGFGAGNGECLPPRQSLEAFGYDPNGYICTSALQVAPYTTQVNIVGRVGGELQRLIPATDDDGTGNLNQPIFNSILANVTTEINGFISSIYPIPLAKTGTVAIVRVIGVDSTGSITAIEMVSNGAYLSAPASPNPPAYLRYSNANSYGVCRGWNWNVNCQKGTGASFTVVFTNPGTVTPQAPIVVNGIPTIAAGGSAYQNNDLLVLTGGQSFVPDKITNAATTLFCYELMRRRLVPDEKNLFYLDAEAVKEELLKISNGELVMDGTYRDFFSPVSAWVQQSVLQGNSL